MVGIALMVDRWYEGWALRVSLCEKEACNDQTTGQISSCSSLPSTDLSSNARLVVVESREAPSS